MPKKPSPNLPQTKTQCNTMTNDLQACPIETHPFEPVLPSHADIMMMGTFPPTSDKWSMTFHYPNYNNDMWRIYGAVFFADKNHFQAKTPDGDLKKGFDPDKIKAFLQKRGIASCPTVRRAIREKGNASDKFLSVVEAVDLPAVLEQVPKVHTIFTTGGKATEVLLSLLPEDLQPKLPKTNQSVDYVFESRVLTLTRLPSTSRAYPLKFDKKVAAYREFFAKVGKL